MTPLESTSNRAWTPQSGSSAVRTRLGGGEGGWRIATGCGNVRRTGGDSESRLWVAIVARVQGCTNGQTKILEHMYEKYPGSNAGMDG
jgi:hypothetical protein